MDEGVQQHMIDTRAPPLERPTRHGAARHPSTLRLVDVDGVAMSAVAAYKTMSMDIVEGHQIGLYHDDGRIKYPHHHSLVGGSDAVAALSVTQYPHDNASARVAAGVTRKRPWSANPSGRPVSPSAVRDVMKVDDIEGSKPSYFQRARQESDNLNVSDLNQKRRSPSPRRVATSPLRVVDPTPFDAYNAFHKHTSMHRTKDQSGVAPTGQRQRPWSAGVVGRAPHSNPLNPVYYVAAPTAYDVRTALPLKPTTAGSALVRDLMERNEQPSSSSRGIPASATLLLADDARVNEAVAAGRIVISRPIHSRAAPMTRKGAGSFKTQVEADQAKVLMMEDAADSTAPAWDKLRDVKLVNQRLNIGKQLAHELRDKREASAMHHQQLDADAAMSSTNGVGPNALLMSSTTTSAGAPSVPYPTHLNPHMDHRDVPFATSAWKLRLLECRARRKTDQRDREVRQEKDDATALRQRMARPRYASPPNCVNFGPSACSTTTTHYTAFTAAHHDACDEAATRGASPKVRAPANPRRLAEGQHAGIEQCLDIAGAAANGDWKRPNTTSNLMLKIHRDVAIAQQLANHDNAHSNVLTGTSSGRYSSPLERSKTAVTRPASATVRSATTGAVAADQRAPSMVEAAPRPPASGKRNEISVYAAAMQRSGVAFTSSQRGPTAAADPQSSSSMAQRPQSASLSGSVKSRAAGASLRPPAHAADRKDLRYRLEVGSVRDLPNFV